VVNTILYKRTISLVVEKTKASETKARIHQSKEINVLQHKMNSEKLKPASVTFYDIRPGNGTGLFSKENTSK